MFLGLQAVSPSVSIPIHNSIREIQVQGITGVSEPSLIGLERALNKKERKERKKKLERIRK